MTELIEENFVGNEAVALIRQQTKKDASELALPYSLAKACTVFSYIEERTYRKVPKFSDARKLCCKLPKIHTKGYYTKKIQMEKQTVKTLIRLLL